MRYKIISGVGPDVEDRMNRAAEQGYVLHSWRPVGPQSRVVIIMEKGGGPVGEREGS